MEWFIVHHVLLEVPIMIYLILIYRQSNTLETLIQCIKKLFSKLWANWRVKKKLSIHVDEASGPKAYLGWDWTQPVTSTPKSFSNWLAKDLGWRLNQSRIPEISMKGLKLAELYFPETVPNGPWWKGRTEAEPSQKWLQPSSITWKTDPGQPGINYHSRHFWEPWNNVTITH